MAEHSEKRILFAGTPEIAANILDGLYNHGCNIAMVLTQPDRPAGRGQKLQQSAVKQYALAHDLELRQPASLRDPEIIAELEDLDLDLIVVVAYGILLPKDVLELPAAGCINIHTSILPRWRGAAPFQRAILAGDEETGITIMQLDEGLDSGPILLQSKIQINSTDTSKDLHDKLASLSVNTLLDSLDSILDGSLTPRAQDETLATYAEKIHKSESKIDWQYTAVHIERMVRAFNPWPVTTATINGTIVRIWQAAVMNETDTEDHPGTILQANRDGIDVATGKGILRLLQIQLPGSKVMSVNDVLNSKKELFSPGEVFDLH